MNQTLTSSSVGGGKWVTGRRADVVKGVDRDLPQGVAWDQEGVGTCFSPFTREETGARGGEAACLWGEAARGGAGP